MLSNSRLSDKDLTRATPPQPSEWQGSSVSWMTHDSILSAQQPASAIILDARAIDLDPLTEGRMVNESPWRADSLVAEHPDWWGALERCAAPDPSVFLG